jgi:hypothetical protein
VNRIATTRSGLRSEGRNNLMRVGHGWRRPFRSTDSQTPGEENRIRDRLSRGFRTGRSGGVSPPRPDPREVAPPFGAISLLRSRYSVHDSRLVVSTTSRSSGIRTADAGAPTAPMGLDSSSGSPIRPGRLPQEPAPLMRFSAPIATWAWRSTDPGVQPGSFRLQVFSTS